MAPVVKLASSETIQQAVAAAVAQVAILALHLLRTARRPNVVPDAVPVLDPSLGFADALPDV